MTEAERRLIRESVMAWRRAGPELERVRCENIRRTDAIRGLRAFRGLALAALRTSGAPGSSGLVEQTGVVPAPARAIRSLIELARAAAELRSFFEAREWPFCLVQQGRGWAFSSALRKERVE